MKKKIVSLILAAAVLISISVSAMASFVGSPSLEPEVDSDDKTIEIVTDNVVTGGYIRQKGTSETRPLNQIDYPVIKITTMAVSIPANAKIDAENPDATYEQKAGMMTDTALSYGKNATVNEVADHYYDAGTTSEFLDNYSMSLIDRVVAAANGQLDHYSAIQIADISANVLAIDVADGSGIQLTFNAPGVKSGSRVKVVQIKDNSAEFISASAGNGSISFSVTPSDLGTFVLLTYVG